MASADDVQLPDLQVIQRYSLAVRGATAPLADVVAALQADLAWLTGTGTGTGRRRPAPAPGGSGDLPRAAAAKKAAPGKQVAAKRTPATKTTAPKKPTPTAKRAARRA